jgi:hypothetical protein
LKDAGIISNVVYKKIEYFKVPRQSKIDPEIPNNLPIGSRTRVHEMLQHGLSTYYVHLCFDAYLQRLITRGRLAETLLIDEGALPDIAKLYNLEAL